jgi:hypothetical protein
VLAAAALAASCGSGSGTGVGRGPLEPSFESIQNNIFTPICAPCHVGATAPAGLRLDAANSYTLLVGVRSVQTGALRVAPGDPNGSYLIHKLEGSAAVGSRMPLGGAPLPQADINVIRQWIRDGAQPPPVPFTAEPPRVTTLSPLPESSVPMAPMSVIAAFDRPLDATTVDRTTFVVERSGRDGVFGNGNDVVINPVSVSVPAANPQSAVFDMGNVAPIEDIYRVTLLGTGPATIRDLDGKALAGAFTREFPSVARADGNFVATFRVVGTVPTLESIQDNVFTPLCAGCHTGPQSHALPAGLDLTSLSLSFTSLVDVASAEQPEALRVARRDPNASYLIRKLEGTDGAGGHLSLAGRPLDAATVDMLRQWITNGASM